MTYKPFFHAHSAIYIGSFLRTSNNRVIAARDLFLLAVSVRSIAFAALVRKMTMTFTNK